MHRTVRLVAIALAVAALFAAGPGSAWAQQDMPPMPKPGPEHEILKMDAGTWDAVVEMFAAPGQPPATSKGTETSALMGGLWLVSEFKGDMMGSPFEGRGIFGYDLTKKKYVGVWVDSMSAGIAHVESTYDATTKTMTGTFTFTRAGIVGTKVVDALPSIELLQDFRAPNVLQVSWASGEFVDFQDEGLLHNSSFLAGRYDYENSRVRFNALGRLLKLLVPTAWVGHMLGYVVRKP